VRQSVRISHFRLSSGSTFALHVIVCALLIIRMGGPALAADFEGVIVAVPEGDALEVLSENTVFFIRLQDVDAPEIDQPYGREAQVFLDSLARGQPAKVTTMRIPKGGTPERGKIALVSGLNLSHELLKAGLAWWDRKAAPNNDSLWKLERDARIEQRGLWKDSDPIPPWEWRKGF
jgi:micrococcal nuclease